MATTNGTLKYKQDDGSIVELNPVGVDARAQTLATAAGQTANNAQAAAENVQQTVNGIATQIQLIEETTGYNASPEDVPATSMKASIDALNTKVTNLENAAFKSQYFFPAFGTVIESTASSVTVAFPMPEELYNILGFDSGFSTVLAVVKTRTAGGSSPVAYCATRTTEQALVAFVVDGKHLSVNKEMGYLYATFNTGIQNATKCIGMPVVPFRDQSFCSVPYISATLS